MYLRKHDLLQMDDEWLTRLPVELLLEVSKRLLHDVKELQDRLPESAPEPRKQLASADQPGALGETRSV
ncbi:MAG: hypothetical protein V5B36_06225 [Candidatus Accumulibacter sp. UW25]